MNLPEPIHCFFCEKKLIPIECQDKDKEFYKEWFDKYGHADFTKAKIGQFSICRNCANDICNIMEA